jgi:hypothetical protein
VKKPVKIVLGLFGGLFVLIIIIVVCAAMFVNSIARQGIQVGATYALGVNATLDSASVGLFSGNFGMDGLKVDNPKGFDGKFMQLGHGGVAVSLGTLSSSTIVLPKLELSGLDIDLERNSTGANYTMIMDNLKRLESGQTQQPKASSGPGKQFKVNEISITNVTAHVDLLGGAGGVSKLTIPIQEIKLTNVGSDGSGVDLAKLTSIILQAVLTAVVDKGGGLIPADVANEIKNGLNQLSGLRGVGVQSLGKVGEDAAKAEKAVEKDVKNEEEKLKKGIGDLIPGGKKPGK